MRASFDLPQMHLEGVKSLALLETSDAAWRGGDIGFPRGGKKEEEEEEEQGKGGGGGGRMRWVSGMG